MNEYFAKSLAEVLEETSTNMGNAMVLGHLEKNGSVSIEEASFYHNLCADVITEAAEDFIPDTVEVPESPEAQAPIELYDAVGNKYIFQDGQLIPVENDEAGEAVEGEEAIEAPMQESTEAPSDAEVLEESTTPVTGEEVPAVEGEQEVLEESDSVVARILANLNS